MEYPKINSLFKRDPETHKFMLELSKPEFDMDRWHVEEKIDGMNIRVYFMDGIVTDIKGRTDAASIPPKLLAYFKNNEDLKSMLPLCLPSGSGIMYGEGYGAGIQKGGIYRSTQSFCMFDMYFNGRWSTRLEVYELALKCRFEIPYSFGIMTRQQIIDFIRSKPLGRNAEYTDASDYVLEGIIARSIPLMRFNDRSANPVMWKLKVRDYENGENK